MLRIARFVAGILVGGLVLSIPFIRSHAVSSATQVSVIVELKDEPAAVYKARTEKAGGTVSQDQVTRIDYHDPDNHRFSMMIELINQFVLISLAERDQPEEVKGANRFARLLGLE